MEKTLLYCFTGTGNSLQVAKDLKENMKECKIEAIRRDKVYSLQKYKRIGFIFPTYYFGLPLQVKKFLEDINIKENIDTDFFAISTCGSNTGNSFEMINNILKSKGTFLRYSNKINMPDNYIFLYETKEVNNNHKKYYEESMVEISKDILQGKKINLGRGNIFYKLIYKVGTSFFKNTDRNFKVTGCINCGVCEMVCPAKNIVLEDGSPKFNHRCEQCTACIQYCPAKAINYKEKTNKRKRYTNPNITVDERKVFYK